MIRLEIETDNAAFVGCENDDGSKERELCRILRDLADKLDEGRTFPLLAMDYNGNKVGELRERGVPVEYVCSTCASEAVEIECWVNLNTGTTSDSTSDGTNCYCNACGEHRRFTSPEEYELAKKGGAA